MTLHSLESGYLKLDGGAMFGVVPRSIWQRTNPPDANNMIEMAMRLLLIEDGGRLILIDTGIGSKQSEKFFGFYYLRGDNCLETTLKNHGFHPNDITDVFFTHLHFDHCGGAIVRSSSGALTPTFSNATYWSNKDHWSWATDPNPREKASFLKENILPIQESGQLKFLETGKNSGKVNSELPFEIITVNGHTEAQMLPKIRYKEKTIIYAADLIPTAGHVPIPYVMSYDTRPLLTMKEKTSILEKAKKEECLLFLEHDPQYALITLCQTEKGVRLKNKFNFSEIF